MSNYGYAWRLMWLVFLVAVVAVGVFTAPSDSSSEPDYEMQANCIAEYDYTHPDNPTFDNLVAALKECR